MSALIAEPLHPIDENYKTKDMTQFVDPVSGNYQLYKSKTKKTAALLAIFLGWTGAHFFYLASRKKAFCDLGHLAIIGGVGSLLFFFSEMRNFGLGYLLLSFLPGSSIRRWPFVTSKAIPTKTPMANS
jgi:hypothetical protein